MSEASLDINASPLEVATYHLDPSNGKYQEEKQQDDDGVSEKGKRSEKSSHQNLETFNA